MNSLIITIVLTTTLLILALLGLWIGSILTGRETVRSCRYNPLKKPGEPCNKEERCPTCQNHPQLNGAELKKHPEETN